MEFLANLADACDLGVTTRGINAPSLIATNNCQYCCLVFFNLTDQCIIFSLENADCPVEVSDVQVVSEFQATGIFSL